MTHTLNLKILNNDAQNSPLKLRASPNPRGSFGSTMGSSSPRIRSVMKESIAPFSVMTGSKIPEKEKVTKFD